MDGTAVESAFALLLTKVTKEGLVPDTSRTTNVREDSYIIVSGESFLNIAMSGVNKNYVPYLALKQKRGEKIYDEKNNQWHDRSRFTGS